MKICKRVLHPLAKSNVLCYCVSDDFQKLYVMYDGNPHEIFEIIKPDHCTYVDFNDNCYNQFTQCELPESHLYCKIRCACKEEKHYLFEFRGVIYILILRNQELTVVCGHITYSISIPCVDGKGNIQFKKNEVIIQASNHILVKTTINEIIHSIEHSKVLSYTQYPFQHSVVSFQEIDSSNAFRRNDLLTLLGKPKIEDKQLVVYGKNYPIAYKSLEKDSNETYSAVFPDTRDIVSVEYNPINEKYTLLADAHGRVLVFDTDNRFIEKIVQQFREAQLCWINQTIFAVFSNFRKILAIYSCEKEERLAFWLFEEKDVVHLTFFGINEIVLIVNDSIHIVSLLFEKEFLE
ncbi:Uncharacterized protein QTN25_002533 [Entamoeba marina]